MTMKKTLFVIFLVTVSAIKQPMSTRRRNDKSKQLLEKYKKWVNKLVMYGAPVHTGNIPLHEEEVTILWPLSSYDHPDYEDPTYDESYQDRSSYDQSSYDQSSHDQSSYAQSSHDQSSYAQSSHDQSSYAQSADDQSSYAQSSHDQSSYDQSSYDQSSMTNRPITNRPITNRPSTYRIIIKLSTTKPRKATYRPRQPSRG